MNWKHIVKSLGRGAAAAQIATQLATVPITKDGTPDLVKQYRQYAKNVKLQDIHSQMRKQTNKSYVPVAVLDKRTSKKLRNA